MADGQQIEGLPEGAQVRPLGGSPHEEIQGLPEGAEVRPLDGGDSSEQTQQVSGPSKSGAAIPAFSIPVDQRNAPGRSQADYDIRQSGEAQKNWRDPGYQFNRITHNSPTPFTDVAMAMYPAAGIGEEAATQGIKTAAKGVGRGLLKSAAGAGVGGGVGAGVGSIFGHPQEGAQIGATMGGVGAPFAPDAWFSRAPYGMNRVILGEEGLADAQAASKLARRNADIRAGLITTKVPVTPPTIYDEMANSAQYKDMARAAGAGEKVKKFPPPPLGPVNRTGPSEELPSKAPIPSLGKPVSRFNEPELPSKAPIPPLAGPNRNTPSELPYKASIPPPGPVNRMGEDTRTWKAPIPPIKGPYRPSVPSEEGAIGATTPEDLIARNIAEKAARGAKLTPEEEEILRKSVQQHFTSEAGMNEAARRSGMIYAGRGTAYRPTNEQIELQRRFPAPEKK